MQNLTAQLPYFNLSGNTRIAYQFKTLAHPYFTDLHNQWYRKVDGKYVKVLPSNFASLLTPIALAYWLCGDGSFCQRFGIIRIATDCFTAAEVDILRSA